MIDLAGLQERYLRDAEPMRMGHLASDLLRLSRWVSQHESDEMAVELMDLIAWMLEANPEFASEELADMQREICHWRRIWPVEAARSLLAFRARRMSDRILELSGLLDEGNPPAAAEGESQGLSRPTAPRWDASPNAPR